MPARVFRSTLENTVPGHTLRLVSSRCCGGEWTSDSWKPPQSIPAGGKGGWQSESAGFLTGTEGWVKYRLIRESDKSERGLVYIYWNNPYFGATYPRWALVGNDILAHCKETGQEQGSTFGSEQPPHDLRLMPSGVLRNGSPTTLEELSDLVGWLGFALGGPATLPLFMGIWERMEVRYSLSRTGRGTELPFPNPKAQVKSVEVNPQPSNWAGHWVGEEVDVRISLVGYNDYRVQLHDGRAPILQLDETVSLDEEGFARSIADGLETVSPRLTEGLDVRAASATLGALAVKLERERGAKKPWLTKLGEARSLPSVTADKVHEWTSNAKLGQQQSKVIGALIDEFLRRAKYTIHVGPQVALFLVRVEEEGRLVDRCLRYQRRDDNGDLIANVDLGYRPDVH